MIIFPGVFFFFFLIFIFWAVTGGGVGVGGGGERAKNGPKCHKVLSMILHISEIIYHMIVIYGAHV